MRRSTAKTVGRARGLLGGMAAEAYYLLAQHRLTRSLTPTAKTAVCVHVYYTDKWGLLARHLANVRGIPHDLFVTIPWRGRRFAQTIRTDFPDAHIVTVPNRGRGTLPFSKVARVLLAHEYEVALKLHCKRPGTAQNDLAFMQTVLDDLLPDSKPPVLDIVRRLESSEAAMIGSGKVYLPLDTALSANRDRLKLILDRLCGAAVAQRVLSRPAEYGFFAGSMFWVRLDAIAPLLDFRAYQFEREREQINATLPHVLERTFSLLPRLQGLTILEVVDGCIRPCRAESANVLWWWTPLTPLPGDKILEKHAPTS